MDNFSILSRFLSSFTSPVTHLLKQDLSEVLDMRASPINGIIQSNLTRFVPYSCCIYTTCNVCSSEYNIPECLGLKCCSHKSTTSPSLLSVPIVDNISIHFTSNAASQFPGDEQACPVLEKIPRNCPTLSCNAKYETLKEDVVDGACCPNRTCICKVNRLHDAANLVLYIYYRYTSRLPHFHTKF